MYRHGPTSLAGPVSWARVWWLFADPTPAPETDPVPNPSPTPADGPRRERIERVRREIAEGVYDTPEKWRQALERFLDRLDQA